MAMNPREMYPEDLPIAEDRKEEFERFQASRRFVPNIWEDRPLSQRQSQDYDSPDGLPGFRYIFRDWESNPVYISIMTEELRETLKSDRYRSGAFWCQVGEIEYLTDNLSDLEAVLFNYF